MDLNSAKALAVNRISFLRENEKTILMDIIALPEDLAGMTVNDLCRITARKIRTGNFRPDEILEKAEKDFNQLEKGEFSIRISGSRDYPMLLSEIYDPPFLLYIRGESRILSESCTAVVGTRNPDRRAESAAFRWGSDFAHLDVNVVSGLALGIDTAAHSGCLAGGGKCIAVLGSAVDEIYPVRNRSLAARIISGGGAVVSEFPPGTKAAKYNFPRRNRIISGLSAGTVVIQAPVKSGALITADYALEQGRDVFVEKGCLGLPNNEGCRELEFSGAQAAAAAHETGDYKKSPGIIEIDKNNTGDGNEIAGIMEMELTDMVLRYKTNFYKAV